MLEVTTRTLFNGHSMVAPLKRVVVCSPRTAGWNQPDRATHWRALGFHHAPDFDKAQSQHDTLCHELKSAGVELITILITRNLLILGTATKAKKAPLPDPLYVYCTKMLFALEFPRTSHSDHSIP